MFDFIIVGAGFAGSVLAERIANKLNKKVLLIEKRNHLGGNCYDFRNEYGIIIHKYGPHLFHTNSKKVWDYLSNFTDWRYYNHKVLAFIDGKKVPIPFNLNSIEELFPKQLAEKLIDKLLLKYSYGKKVPILKLLEDNDTDIKFLANFIYEKVFKNYTYKQWGLDFSSLTQEVTARVPVLISRDDRYFQDKYQAVPLDGYTKIFERMLYHSNIKILLNTDFREFISIDLDSKKIFFLGKEFKGKLIFTGPIDQLFNYQFGFLPYRSLSFKFKTLNISFYQEVATVNYPNNYDFTRITEYKHIHPFDIDKTTVCIEYPKDYNPEKDIPYYPFFTKEAKELYLKYMELSKQFDNLILVGRLAEYKYYNMDSVIERALNIFEEKIL